MRKEAVGRVDAAVMKRRAIVAGIDEGQNIEEEKNAGGFGDRWSPSHPAYSGTEAGQQRDYYMFFSSSFKYSTCFNSWATISSKITVTSGSAAVSANFI